ncbi:hypothetical protein [Bacillus inaquosorum]|uniref:exodeoxyribonuclease X C-terminal domain-containing protein n=1 Tax=Bacillus inaquosorum TaxID=483913 RepID=UPI0022826B4C|nr:hypothetical protein [Bacillus inaquosorum]MCY8860344.1 hypothetical protein [Bacillus inaquosorum]MCY8875853.1 hypothetical protein [Bacillus inaquosorum]
MYMSFGKYKGEEIEEVFLKNPGYFKWMKEKGMTEKDEYFWLIEVIAGQYPEKFDWDIEIREGYKCWNCKKDLNIMLMFNPEKIYDDRHEVPVISECSYNKPDSILPIAEKFGVKLENRYSKTVNQKYIMHICPHCNMHQGDHSVVEDNHQKTKLLHQFRTRYIDNQWVILK